MPRAEGETGPGPVPERDANADADQKLTGPAADEQPDPHPQDTAAPVDADTPGHAVRPDDTQTNDVRADGVQGDGVRGDGVRAEAVPGDAAQANDVQADAAQADAVRTDDGALPTAGPAESASQAAPGPDGDDHAGTDTGDRGEGTNGTHRTTGDLAAHGGAADQGGPAGQNGPTAKDGTVKHGAVRDNAAKNDATGSGRPGSGGSSAEQKRAASERSADDDAWAEIVAAYGEEPPDPPGVAPWSAADGRAESMMDGSGREIAPGKPDKTLGTADDATPTRRAGADGSEGRGPDTDPDDSQARPAVPVGSSVVFAPGVGPRDWRPAEPSDNDLDATDEGHFVPPEPPPLPRADTTARFAWLAVLGGPLLLLLMVVFQQEITWWIATLGVGGFLGGFATLVMRMRSDDEEDEDPGRGAVV